MKQSDPSALEVPRWVIVFCLAFALCCQWPCLCVCLCRLFACSNRLTFVRTLRSCAQRTATMRDEVVRVVDGRFGATMSTSDQVPFFSLTSVFKILLQSFFCCKPVLVILVDGTINARETLGGKDGSHRWEVFLLSALVLCKDSVCTAVALVTCRFLFTDGAQNCCISKPWPYFHGNTWPQAERHYSMRPVVSLVWR